MAAKKTDSNKSPSAAVMTQLATRIPRSLHRTLKLHCVKAETTVSEFVITALETALKKVG